MATKPENEQEFTDADFSAAQAAEDFTFEDFLAAQRAETEAAESLLPRPPTDPIPQIGAPEAAINSAANTVPFGRLLTDIGIGGQVAAAPRLGRLLPRALAAKLPGVVPGPGATLTPQARAELQAMGESVPEEPPLPDLVQSHRDARDLRRARTELGEIQRPLSSALGKTAGLGLSILAPLPGFKGGAPASAPLLHRVGSGLLSGGKTGAAYGALAGLTDGAADLTRPSEQTAVQAGKDVALGSLVGGGFGAAVGGAIPAAQELWRGLIKPSVSALYLRAKGVPLSIGQMEPRSATAQFEEAATSVGGVGTAIKNVRDQARPGWQNAVLDEARPPGMQRLDVSKPVDERLSDAYEGFQAAYAPAKGLQLEPRTSEGVPLLSRPPPQPAPPLPTPANAQPTPAPSPNPAAPRAPAGSGDFKQGKDGKWRDPKGRFVPLERLPPELRPVAAPKTPDAPEYGPREPKPAFEAAADDQSIAATDEQRNVVRKFLRNQLTLLGDADTGTVSSDRLLKMRSNIREEIRAKNKAQDFDVARLLSRAEDELSDVIESSVPASVRDGVRAADAQYRQYKIVEDAVAKSGDQPDGFTPAQLSAAIRASTERGRYARGDGGTLRDLAAHGREVLDSKVPPTGARLLTIGPGRYLTTPMALAANTSGGQRFMLGQTPVQRYLQSKEALLAEVLRHTPSEAVAREVVEPDETPPAASRAMPGQPLESENMRRQRALAEAIRRLGR